jgi:hypothetical protein
MTVPVAAIAKKPHREWRGSVKRERARVLLAQVILTQPNGFSSGQQLRFWSYPSQRAIRSVRPTGIGLSHTDIEQKIVSLAEQPSVAGGRLRLREMEPGLIDGALLSTGEYAITWALLAQRIHA